MADLILDTLRRSYEAILAEAKNGTYPVSDDTAVNRIGMDGLVLYVLLRIEQRLESIDGSLLMMANKDGKSSPEREQPL